VSRDQNAGRSQNIKIDNSFFERVEEFKYSETNLTNQNSSQKDIRGDGSQQECLLSWSAEYFTFQLAIQKYKV
jgi:hypothetical protein